jgi:cytidylate kinase
MNNKIKPENIDDIVASMKELEIKIEIDESNSRSPKYYINKRQIDESEFRNEIISRNVAYYAKIKEVRDFIKKIQRDTISKIPNMVIEGRDIGTEICPEAELKVYLTSDVEERARRRYLELQSRGEQVEYDQVLHDLKERDYEDQHRAISPLRIPNGAKVLDNTLLTISQQVEQIITWYNAILDEAR